MPVTPLTPARLTATHPARRLAIEHSQSTCIACDDEPAPSLTVGARFGRYGWIGKALAASGIVLMTTAGCDHSAPPTPPAESTDAHTQPTHQWHADKGPVRFTVQLDRTEAQIAETIRVSLEVAAPKGVAVTLPDHSDRLGPFDVLRVTDTPDLPPDLPADGQRVWLREYELESRVSGEQHLPPITVNFNDPRGNEPIRGTLTSEPIPIQIATVLEGQADPARFRDIKGAVELPEKPDPSGYWIAAGVGGSALLLLAGGVLWVRRNNKRAQTTSAHQWALEQLQLLEQSRLIDQGMIQEYYHQLSGIIRSYIERRFFIHAPMLTTAEFLDEAKDHPTVSAPHRRQIDQFLRRADRVKFAHFTPTPEDHLDAIQAARRFVEQTTQPQEQPDKNQQAGVAL